MKLWKWWILVVVAVSGPWFGVTRTPQWQRVTWIPFHGFEDKPRDVAVNFLLFVPFGVSFARDGRNRRPLAGALLAGAALSIPVEISQLFFVMRDPSATDVLMAICGTAAGSLAAQAFERRDASGAPGRGEARKRCCEQ
jgi:glycopeptide antibiotics resistance protein